METDSNNFPREYLKFASKFCSYHIKEKGEFWRPEREEEERLAFLVDEYPLVWMCGISSFNFFRFHIVPSIMINDGALLGIALVLFFVFDIVLAPFIYCDNCTPYNRYFVSALFSILCVYFYSAGIVIKQRNILLKAAQKYIAGELDIDEFKSLYSLTSSLKYSN
jgi:hypothetical protein